MVEVFNTFTYMLEIKSIFVIYSCFKSIVNVLISPDMLQNRLFIVGANKTLILDCDVKFELSKRYQVVRIFTFEDYRYISNIYMYLTLLRRYQTNT